jgi:hypothetical protein
MKNGGWTALLLACYVGSCDGFRLAVVSKIIVDTVEGGAKRLGGGGVQAAVGARLAGATQCTLYAPVGQDFDMRMLVELQERGVSTDEVCKLAHVPKTPGEDIHYDSEGRLTWEPVGWDSWPELCAWVPTPALDEFDAIHVRLSCHQRVPSTNMHRASQTALPRTMMASVHLR